MNELTSLKENTERSVIRVKSDVHKRVNALRRVLIAKNGGDNVTQGKVVEEAIILFEKKVAK